MSYTFEFGNDFEYLKEILMSRPKEDYPYEMDNFFDPYKYNMDYMSDNVLAFTLLARDKNGEVVATYAARFLEYSEYENFFEKRTISLGGTYHNPKIYSTKDTVQWYSSCQWVHTDHRGQRLGIDMDAMKTHKIWELGGDINYANCKEDLKDYHVSPKGLNYDIAQPQAFIPYGGVGGAGSDEDKNYFLVYKIPT
jgi:hypothetical protein